MLNQVQITFITPQSVQELEARREDFDFLYHFSPYKLSKEEIWDILVADIPFNTLVYGNGILLGCFTLDVYTNSVELHGICRPDISKVVPGYRRVKLGVYNALLRDIFTRLNKDKVIIKGELDNKGVRGFATIFGFERLANRDKGRIVWKLTKDKYLSLMAIDLPLDHPQDV